MMPNELSNCETYRQVPTDKGVACCGECSKGFGMVKLCSTTNATICESCKDGQTYSDGTVRFGKCQPCIKCTELDDNAVTKVRCTASSNTICECIRGFYMNERSNCLECTKCGLGQGRVRKCTANTDTLCQACTYGTTFSQFNAETSNHECVPCNTCPTSFKKTSNCTLEHDTFCQTSDGRILDAGSLRRLQSIIGDERSKSNLLQRRWIQQQKSLHVNSLDNNTAVVTNIHAGDHGKNLIPLYCGIMGLLIVGLVVYVIVKYWKGRSARLAVKVTSISNSSRGPTTCSLPIEPLLAKNSKLLTIQPWNLTEIANKRARSVDSGLGTELASAAMSSRCFRDVDEDVKRQMESALITTDSIDVSWRQLANQLGYNETEMFNFESEAIEKQMSAFRYLLEVWGADSYNTVGLMLQALQKIHRQDLMLLLREEKGAAFHNPTDQPDVRSNFSSTVLSLDCDNNSVPYEK